MSDLEPICEEKLYKRINKQNSVGELDPEPRMCLFTHEAQEAIIGKLLAES